MCNAWNHSPGCTCGWGGKGHSGKSPGGFTQRHFVGSFAGQTPSWYRAPSSHASYCAPNAHCPVCGEAVFYYQSPNGGRVFFDELGPPWPKHPCTDQPGTRWNLDQVRPSTTPNVAARRFAWQEAEWVPVLWVRIRPITSQEVTEVSGFAGDTTVRGFVANGHVAAGAPWLARAKADGNWEFTTLVTSPTSDRVIAPVVLTGYQKLADAAAYARKHRFGTGSFRVAPADGRRPLRTKSAEPVTVSAEQLLAQWRHKHDGLRHNRPLWIGVAYELQVAYPRLSTRQIEEALALHIEARAYKERKANTDRRYSLDGRRVNEKRRARELVHLIEAPGAPPSPWTPRDGDLRAKLRALSLKYLK